MIICPNEEKKNSDQFFPCKLQYSGLLVVQLLRIVVFPGRKTDIYCTFRGVYDRNIFFILYIYILNKYKQKCKFNCRDMSCDLWITILRPFLWASLGRK